MMSILRLRKASGPECRCAGIKNAPDVWRVSKIWSTEVATPVIDLFPKVRFSTRHCRCKCSYQYAGGAVRPDRIRPEDESRDPYLPFRGFAEGVHEHVQFESR